MACTDIEETLLRHLQQSDPAPATVSEWAVPNTLGQLVGHGWAERVGDDPCPPMTHPTIPLQYTLYLLTDRGRQLLATLDAITALRAPSAAH